MDNVFGKIVKKSVFSKIKRVDLLMKTMLHFLQRFVMYFKGAFWAAT